jgi:hypothetical protein
MKTAGADVVRTNAVLIALPATFSASLGTPVTRANESASPATATPRIGLRKSLSISTDDSIIFQGCAFTLARLTDHRRVCPEGGLRGFFLRPQAAPLFQGLFRPGDR